MRAFYLQWEICQTPSGKFAAQTKGSPFSQLPAGTADQPADTQLAAAAAFPDLVGAFRLPWSHYVQLLAARYRTALPSEKLLVAEMDQTRKMLESRGSLPSESEPGGIIGVS